MAKSKFNISKIKEYLITFGLVGGLLTGGLAYFWATYAEPRIKCQIEEEQKPIVERIIKIEDLLVYQNIVHLVRADSTEKAEIDQLYKIYKRGKGK